ncbi:hypothetical protein H2508_03760 [Parahaliea sp. F7430]|uniref:Uncharacterized protein n=1 Tax=Sediminihaliea albiluteola TaxID=2758564 RepID=A0A7W2YJ38_9GAMM|nr:hypothetical protein [Sediminihaliea albiluteola]MBA6412219.1 hypothetical protein [Sediminihaliea albiluteola]
MKSPLILTVVGSVAVITIVAALAWLTQENSADDGCQQKDVSAAVLADSDGDQEGLINRAIIVRGNCDQNERD